MNKLTIIDANGLILGRLSSVVATRLLKGEKIDIINTEKLIISGKSSTILKEYQDSINRGSKEHGPYFPKRPDRIMKRTIRSMLPYKKQRGKNALLNLKIYLGIPNNVSKDNVETIEEASMKRLNRKKYVRLGEISSKLGSKFN